MDLGRMVSQAYLYVWSMYAIVRINKDLKRERVFCMKTQKDSGKSGLSEKCMAGSFGEC